MLSYALFSREYAAEIARIFNGDHSLRQAVGCEDNRIFTLEDVYWQEQVWERKKQGVCYSILLNGKCIGTISYHKSQAPIAVCGYWLKSRYWNCGYMTQAFAWMIQLLRKLGFQKVMASIALKNIASLKIWQRYPIQKIIIGTHCRVTLAL